MGLGLFGLQREAHAYLGLTAPGARYMRLNEASPAYFWAVKEHFRDLPVGVQPYQPLRLAFQAHQNGC